MWKYITWTSKRKRILKVSGKTTYSENVVDFESIPEYFLFERYSLYVMKNNSLRRAYTTQAVASSGSKGTN